MRFPGRPCPQGHTRFFGVNKRGHRICNLCRAEKQNRRYHAKKARETVTAARLVKVVGMLRKPTPFDKIQEQLGTEARATRNYLHGLRVAGLKIKYSRKYDSYRIVGFE